MRPLSFLPYALLAALALAGPAAAAKLPDTGFVVYKDFRGYAVVEVREKATGRVVSHQVDVGEKGGTAGACGDSHHTFIGPKWAAFERYAVDVASFPSYLDASATLAQIVSAHGAWESPFTTDCPVPGTTKYRALYGGTTGAGATLLDFELDGVNAVAFRSLAGTPCDGALACVVVDYEGSKIAEADIAFERDLARLGFPEVWTSDDGTSYGAGGRIAVVDTATHEWGHFAGLGHVNKSPALTMYPYIHDGMQTLGLGDMKGVVARY